MSKERKRKNEDVWTSTRLGKIFIGKLKESLKNSTRQPKQTIFEIPVNEDEVDKWTEAFEQKKEMRFDENFPPSELV